MNDVQTLNRVGWCRLSLLILVSFGAACSRDVVASQRPKGPLATGIAARFGGQTITVAELDQKVAAEIFDLRSNVLRIVLIEKLIAQEAESRHLTGKELRRVEVEDKTPLPTEAEGVEALKGWLDSGKIDAAQASRTTPSQAAERLRAIRMRQREEEYYDQLLRKANVQIDFQALGKPTLKLSPGGPQLGAPTGEVKVVEFADFTKPYTTAWQPTLEQLLSKYGRSVSFQFKQKPGEGGTPAAKLAEAVLCAHDQGKYWDYRRALLAKPEAQRVGAIADVAVEVKLDGGAFQACMSSGKNREAVQRDQGEVMENRLEGDPVLSINGIVLNGAQPFEAIDRLLRIETTGSL